MKLKISSSICYLLIIPLSAIYYGCSKNEDITEKKRLIDQTTILTLKKWLLKEKSEASVKDQANIDSILSLTIWEEGQVKNISSTNSVIYLPLKDTKIGLTFFFNKISQAVDSGFIMKIESKDISALPNDIVGIETYYRNVRLEQEFPTRFTGKITAYSIRNTYLYDYGFKDGKIHYRGFIAPIHNTIKIKSDGKKTNAVYCEPWGHYTLYSNGDVVLEYTYLVCTCDQTTAIGIKSGQQYIKTNCSESDAGGTPGIYNPGCPTTEDALTIMNSLEYGAVSGAENGYETGMPVIDPQGFNIGNQYIATKEIFSVKFIDGNERFWKADWSGPRILLNAATRDYRWSAPPTWIGAYVSSGNVPPCMSVNLTFQGYPTELVADGWSAMCPYKVSGDMKIDCLFGMTWKTLIPKMDYVQVRPRL